MEVPLADSTSVKSESCLESRKEYHTQFQGTGILSTTRKAAAKGCRGDETQEAAVMALLLRSCFDLMAQLLDGDRALLFWPGDQRPVGDSR